MRSANSSTGSSTRSRFSTAQFSSLSRSLARPSPSPSTSSTDDHDHTSSAASASASSSTPPPPPPPSNTLTPIEALRVSAVLESAIEKLQLLSLLTPDISLLSLTSSTPTTTTTTTKPKNPDATTSDDPTSGTPPPPVGGVGPTTVANILEEQQTLGQRYEELSSLRTLGVSDLHISLSDQKARETELSQIHQKLKENTKILCRNLKETPNETSNWRKIRGERAELEKVLQSCKSELLRQLGASSGSAFRVVRSASSSLDRLDDQQGHTGGLGLGMMGGGGGGGVAHPATASGRGLGMDGGGAVSPSMSGIGVSSQTQKIRYTGFLQRVGREESSKKYLAQVLEKERQMNQRVRELRDLVDAERRRKEEELQQKTAEVTRLMSELRALRQRTSEEYDKHVANKSSLYECDRRRVKQTISELRDEWRRLRIEVQIEKKVFEETKQFLEQKNAELSQQASHWSEKLDDEQERMQSKLIMWKREREDQIKLKRKLLKEHEEELHSKRIRDESLAREVSQRELERRDRMQEASIAIQLAWKCYKDREIFAQIKKEAGRSRRRRRRGRGSRAGSSRGRS